MFSLDCQVCVQHRCNYPLESWKRDTGSCSIVVVRVVVAVVVVVVAVVVVVVVVVVVAIVVVVVAAVKGGVEGRSSAVGSELMLQERRKQIPQTSRHHFAAWAWASGPAG